MTLIHKAASPKLWELIGYFTYSGGSRSQAQDASKVAIFIELEITTDQLDEMERRIADAEELAGRQTMEEFGSGDMLLDLDGARFEAWIASHGLTEVNRLLNQIYVDGRFLTTDALLNIQE